MSDVRGDAAAPAVERAAPGPAVSGDMGVAAIESLTHDARGVARLDGKATFIEGSLPGERVRFRYRRRHSRYDTGTVVEVLAPSPDRVAPPCGYFGVCGGCALQHLSEPAQPRVKQRQLAETLARVGRVEPACWLTPIQAPTRGYRRRARLGVRVVEKKGGVIIGFRERRRSYITPLTECLTLDPRLSALLPVLRVAISRLSRPDRIPQVEVAAGDDACAAVVRHLEPLATEDLRVLGEFAAAQRVALYLQPGDPKTMKPLSPKSGVALTYRLATHGLTLGFGPTDFVQVNGAVNRALVDLVEELLDPRADEVVLDLFCGLGNFTLPLARRAGWIGGYEGDPALVERARENARRNGIANAGFEVADLFGLDLRRLWTGRRCDKLLLDPPRAGAMEVVKSIPAEGPGRVVYVSCNPATLARDSEYLVNVLGYRLEAAGVADMFPHTSHIEAVALFVRP